MSENPIAFYLAARAGRDRQARSWPGACLALCLVGGGVLTGAQAREPLGELLLIWAMLAGLLPATLATMAAERLPGVLHGEWLFDASTVVEGLDREVRRALPSGWWSWLPALGLLLGGAGLAAVLPLAFPLFMKGHARLWSRAAAAAPQGLPLLTALLPLAALLATSLPVFGLGLLALVAWAGLTGRARVERPLRASVAPAPVRATDEAAMAYRETIRTARLDTVAVWMVPGLLSLAAVMGCVPLLFLGLAALTLTGAAMLRAADLVLRERESQTLEPLALAGLSARTVLDALGWEAMKRVGGPLVLVLLAAGAVGVMHPERLAVLAAGVPLALAAVPAGAASGLVLGAAAAHRSDATMIATVLLAAPTLSVLLLPLTPALGGLGSVGLLGVGLALRALARVALVEQRLAPFNG